MNPDIVEYPLANPTLILSVSEDAFAPETGLQDGISLYIEKFSLKNQLVAENDFDENNSSTATFKLYTHEIDVPEESSDPVSLGLVGKDGTMDHLKGASGGNIDLYVESFSPDSVKKIQINGTVGPFLQSFGFLCHQMDISCIGFSALIIRFLRLFLLINPFILLSFI